MTIDSHSCQVLTRLLKDVAGTTVYDEKRMQSLKLLEDTHAATARIEESLGHIEARLAELEVGYVTFFLRDRFEGATTGLVLTLIDERSGGPAQSTVSLILTLFYDKKNFFLPYCST